MSQQTTIRKLAELVNTPVDKLLEQLAEAGMKFSDPDQAITSVEKLKLHNFLRRAHGKTASVAEEPAAPGKITLSRTRKQEITVTGGAKGSRSASTVEVVTRKKITLRTGAKGGDGATKVDPALDPERAEALRKLEESRARNLAEQQALVERDRQRAEELA
ncbi:MAG: translation initiation factor IF-2, partial [Thermomonas sp.]|nr:translation initiation factor IF-2 [Thermomonas sp.]